MKKSILFRLIVLVLVCAMLFGLMGFTTINPETWKDSTQNEEVTEPISDGEPVPADPVDPDPTDPVDPDPADPVDPDPADPVDAVDPDPADPEEETVTVTLKQPVGGTLVIVKPEEAEGVENKEAGTVTYTFAKGEETTVRFCAESEKCSFVAAYIAVGDEEKAEVEVESENENSAEFETAVCDDNITVSADFFGILSVDVSNPDEWANAKDGGKTVTVKTVGADSAKLGDAEMTKTADGEFTYVVKDQIGEEPEEYTVTVFDTARELEAETAVNVKMIDTVAPIATFVDKVDKRERNDLWSYVTWKLTDGENGSGVKYASKADIKFERTQFGGQVPADTAEKTKEYDPETGILTFKVLAKYYNNLIVTYYDNAGNKGIVDKNVSSKSYVEIVGVDKGQLDETNQFWWAGAGAKLLVYSNKSNKDELKVSFENTDLAIKAEGAADEPGVYQYSSVISKSGEYTATLKDKTADDTVVVNYDPDAPVVTEASYHSAPTPENDNWLKRLLNEISGGYLFNESFNITVEANDGEDNDELGTKASGIKEITYVCLDNGKDTFTPEELVGKEWTPAVLNENGAAATINISEDFRGCIVICVEDNAGNRTLVTVGFDDEAADKTKGELITNKATINDTPRESEDFDPNMTVMVKTPVTDNEGETVYADYDSKDWVRSVKFELRGVIVPPDGYDAENVRFVAMDASGNEIENVLINKAEQVKDTDGNIIPGAYQATATFGEDESIHVSFSGEITFKLVCNYTVPAEYEMVDGVPTEVTPESKKSCESKTATVVVNVQNFLNPATVTVTVNDATTPVDAGSVIGWYNAQNNVLKTANVVGCAGSTAPFVTHYSVYYQSYQDYVAAKSIDKAKLVAKIDAESGSDKKALADITDNIKSIEEPGVYYVKVWSEDAAENYSYGPDGIAYTKAAPAVYTIMIDENQPLINVNFSSDESKDIKYYKYQRTVTIRVIDTSFDESDTFIKDFAVDFPFDPVGNNEGEAKCIESWGYDKNTGNWVCKYVIGNDSNTGFGGSDGDNYNLIVSARDVAGNTVRTNEQGQIFYGTNESPEEGSKAYNEYDVSDFSIDQTKPVVTVTFSNDSCINEKYFNAGRVATITVVDHNFDFKNDKGTVGGVDFKVTGKSDNVPLNEGWVSEGNDKYTKTIKFLSDASCTFDIKVTDMAGNVCDYGDVTYECVAPHEFVIDLTNPTLGTTGTQASPFAEACTPGFSGSDTNISDGRHSAEYTVQLTRSVREHKNQDVTDLFASGGVSMGKDSISAVYANIPDDAENDGIYTLTVSVTDLAGNSSQTSSTFTVNRHGSFYIFNDDLADLVNAKYVQKADGNYSVTEYNASPLVQGSVKIEIYRDGQLVNTLTPAIGASAIGASGLYEYTYDLSADYFTQDGRYSVCITSEDEAKNLSDNTKLDDAILEFTVDSVNPEIVIIKGLEKARNNTEELEFTANVVDTYGIASIQILVDGEVVKEYVTQDAYDQLKASGKDMTLYEVMSENLDFTAAYTLLESNSKQSVEVRITDLAGNSYTTAAEDFDPVYDFHDSVLVSTSFFARYIHNPIALTGTGVVLAGAIWFVLAKRKKNEEEEAAA